MTAILIFLVLPLGLIVLSFFIRPLDRDRRLGDPLGVSQVAGGLFGSHGLEPDEQVVREDTEPVRFQLD
ncbi:hypothetical protein [Deinococcus hopiensis]|jgi:hypothetical protein|uniref:Uncharacterized protein n=1 Tax=Deinococcus hopiensis KR-140 TaxID=695939 RepID=A0A1W1VD43_9DEIO|nr:hypothetical protein [Deinococcus hopiensis]SMB91236.1 hypothetical protein SAMN00790413_01057 [Deinococcus hopiensis KR-140]